MNSLAFFNPRLTSDLFDVIDRNLASLASPSNEQFFSPKTDIRETSDKYILDMDLPGVSEKDIEISLKNRLLSISSKKETKTENVKDGEWHLKERHSMEFSRKFTLPQDIDIDNVSANFTDGVLTISIAKKPEIEAKQILINVN